MEKRSKGIYTAELKSEVVKLELDQGQVVIAVSQRMGIPKSTLSTWVNKARSSVFVSSQGSKTTTLDL
jgi:transposase-like protein